MANEMFDRIKQAIRDNIAAGLPDDAPVSYDYAARAAIGAMRDLTPAIERAGLAANGSGPLPEQCSRVQIPPGPAWRAMIDAILADDETRAE